MVVVFSMWRWPVQLRRDGQRNRRASRAAAVFRAVPAAVGKPCRAAAVPPGKTRRKGIVNAAPRGCAGGNPGTVREA
jgi:hypothetical protein